MHAPPPNTLAWLTFIAAALAAAFALGLWRQAKRTTNIETALRLLERCDAPDVQKGEMQIGWLKEQGHLSNFAAYEAWLNTLSFDDQNEVVKLVNLVLYCYEHIGLVVRKTNSREVIAIITDYISLRCPRLFDALQPHILKGRAVSGHLAFADFEYLAQLCRERLDKARGS
jgi:hypothetical protein